MVCTTSTSGDRLICRPGPSCAAGRDRRRDCRGRIPPRKTRRAGVIERVKRTAPRPGRIRDPWPGRSVSQVELILRLTVCGRPDIHGAADLRALASCVGRTSCTTRRDQGNASFSGHSMSADEIAAKTGRSSADTPASSPRSWRMHGPGRPGQVRRSPARDRRRSWSSTCNQQPADPVDRRWLSGELAASRATPSGRMVAACAGCRPGWRGPSASSKRSGGPC